ncbi:MAG: hypothetical protein ABI878_10270 [Acidobacteriota bacterium]
MTDYSSRPGQAAISPLQLPSSISGIRLGRPILLLFLHPQCSCGRATLSELARIDSETHDLIDIRVFFYQPADQSHEWVETDIWRQASEISDNVMISTIADNGLREFGTLTSGQVLLYNARGGLVFSGGITPGRGHEGDNQGEESIKSFLKSGRTDVPETLVYGCSLYTAD